MNLLPFTLMQTHEHSQTIITETRTFSRLDNNIIFPESTHKLIQNVGRFTENYSSDLLICLSSLTDHICKDWEGIHFFGIRRLGVDSDLYVFLRTRDNANNHTYLSEYYRKIFSVEFHKILLPDNAIQITCQLKDCSNNLRYAPVDNTFDTNEINMIIPIDEEIKDKLNAQLLKKGITNQTALKENIDLVLNYLHTGRTMEEALDMVINRMTINQT